jgi:hypothetical protein
VEETQAFYREGPQGEGGIPWEERERLGFFSALIATIKESLFTPTSFFKKMPTKGGYKDPIFYGVIISWVSAAVAVLFQTLFSITTIRSFVDDPLGAIGTGFIDMAIKLAILIPLPIFIIIGLFLGTGFIHLLLLIVGGASAGFEATFRVISYSTGSSIFAIVPFIGGLVGWIWCVVLEVIGLREAHNTTTLKALLACVIIPIGLAVIIGIILIVLLILGVAFLGVATTPQG